MPRPNPIPLMTRKLGCQIMMMMTRAKSMMMIPLRKTMRPLKKRDKVTLPLNLKRNPPKRSIMKSRRLKESVKASLKRRRRATMKIHKKSHNKQC